MNLACSVLVHLCVSGLVAYGTWLWYRRTDNAAWIDTAWAASIGIGALVHGVSGARNLESWGLPVLMSAWSLRLASHLFHRVSREPEDGRYTALRRSWAARFGARSIPGRFLGFFLLQGLLAALLAVPAGLAAFDPASSWGAWQESALVLGSLSLLGSHVSDARLARFRRDPANKGRVCQDGIWRYSRHPNYFFEILLWISFALWATPAPHGLWAWLAPASIAFFLLKVTGVPLTEAQALRTRGAEYRRYIQTTSAIVPWFNREVPS